ncbi:hypothetical protein EW146_g425 [Bondarzewia mesenterica]|uniref:Cytochrome b5 heme-binding domain-containing protein n=1 Tax=Bondarzewia mesenterica TaxID=1095465 RepID=A0A4S4M8X1_9AGAM|nr:hypothetical protein EW146_g425 [Bondarzewia mesenterica]
MSWITNLDGKPDTTYKDDSPKVADPSIPNRMVSTKRANRPFLAYKEYRDRQQALHSAWLLRKKERDEKLARGEEVGPEEPDPTAEREIGVLDLLKFLVYVLLFITLSGKFIAGDFLWGYEGKWTNLKTYWPTNQRLFSEGFLAKFDGRNPDMPLYLAVSYSSLPAALILIKNLIADYGHTVHGLKIDGDVYDVSSNRRVYGPGGSYHFMAGKDAARAFGTGCFKDHQTHDLRGLSEKELKSVQHWKDFFKDHKSYFKIGRVNHPPIDPASPIPEHCDLKKAEKTAAIAAQSTSTQSEIEVHPQSTSGGGGRDEL